MGSSSRKKYQTPHRTGEDALTRGEYAKALAACGTLMDELIIKLGVSLCLRREDLVHIMIDNIDLQNNTLTYLESKKGDRIRTVPIGANLRQVIIKYLATIPPNQKKLLHICSKTAYNHFQNICDQAGIPRRPIHALRATGIKFYQAAGWTEEQVSELTGDTIRVIREHYTTPSKAEMSAVMWENEVI